MYRDDTCAVCGESLPPDHFYCQEHARTVDQRLHDIAALLPRLAADAQQLAGLLDGVAAETWDYVAEGQSHDPMWPPAGVLRLRCQPEQVAVDVDTEPGLVQVHVRAVLPTLLHAVADALHVSEIRGFAVACANTQGADTTH